jgi:hypothetical protein
MTLEEQYAAATWQFLLKIKGATLNPPANHPVEPDEESVYDIDITSADEVNHLKKLHHDGVVTIQDPHLTGFLSPRQFPIVVTLSLGKKFEDEYKAAAPSNTRITIRLNKINTELYIEAPSGRYQIGSLKPDSAPDRLFSWLMNNEGTHRFQAVKLAAECTEYRSYPTDLARRLSTSKLIREYFITKRSKQEITFRKSVELNQEELDVLLREPNVIKM